MAYYIFYGTDSAKGAELREKFLSDHRRHIASIADRIMLGGRCPAVDGNPRNASFLVVEAASAADARTLIERDPFYSAGVWENQVIREFQPLAGAWSPGKRG
ncbi:MAG: hypothetical protein EXQ85_01690 [Alphaproteobacteria bacterium]|nr:hypothetical protein [Alphaproteobacteria bacterium]